MADKYFLSIIGEMDRLWYRQVILFSQPTTLVSVSPKPVLISESPSSSSSSSSSSILSLQDDETSTDESPSSEKQVSSSESISLPLQDGSIDNKEENIERTKNHHLGSSRIRSHSSSPSTQNRHRKSKKPSKLEKSMSCRTLGELELDEVKGFMDLGFIFKKEYINPRIISVVPGLQRLCSQNQNNQQIDVTENDVEAEAEVEEEDEVEEEEKRDVMRPYLSEAWLIKRPDSPLLNLKIPKPCSASNMKKHLRFWAKTVASEIQQE